MSDEQHQHWLVRPTTIRKLWFGFSAVLVLMVAAQTVIDIKGYFGVDAWFGFAAVYGFLSCFMMVLVAKLLGVVLKRPQDYYPAHKKDQEVDLGQGKLEERSDGA